MWCIASAEIIIRGSCKTNQCSVSKHSKDKLRCCCKEKFSLFKHDSLPSLKSVGERNRMCFQKIL